MAKDNGEEYLEKLLGKVNGDFSDDDFLKDIDEDFPELNDQKFMEEYKCEMYYHLCQRISLIALKNMPANTRSIFIICSITAYTDQDTTA